MASGPSTATTTTTTATAPPPTSTGGPLPELLSQAVSQIKKPKTVKDEETTFKFNRVYTPDAWFTTPVATTTTTPSAAPGAAAAAAAPVAPGATLDSMPFGRQDTYIQRIDPEYVAEIVKERNLPNDAEISASVHPFVVFICLSMGRLGIKGHKAFTQKLPSMLTYDSVYSILQSDVKAAIESSSEMLNLLVRAYAKDMQGTITFKRIAMTPTTSTNSQMRHALMEVVAYHYRIADLQNPARHSNPLSTQTDYLRHGTDAARLLKKAIQSSQTTTYFGARYQPSYSTPSVSSMMTSSSSSTTSMSTGSAFFRT
jgi:hypothetical protein